MRLSPHTAQVINKHRFVFIAGFQLFGVDLSITVILYYDGFHPGRDVAGLVQLCRHDDPVLRVQAITLLFNTAMLSARAALFQQLSAVTWLDEMRYILSLIERTSIPGGAAAIMAFIHRMQLLDQESIDDRFKFYEDSKDVTFDCGADFWHHSRRLRIDLQDCTYRALMVLGAQPRYTPAAEFGRHVS